MYRQRRSYLDTSELLARLDKADLEQRISAVAFESQEGIMITDANKVILRVNQAMVDATGYTADELIGQTPRLLKSDRHDVSFYTDMWAEIHRAGKWQGEIWDKKKDGAIYPKWMSITAVKDTNGKVSHYVGSQVDISERKAAEDEVKHLAFYDTLTELPNRRLLQDRLRQAIASGIRNKRYSALLFIDLDNFKALNDTRGHDIGDLLLKQVADRMLICVRESDTVARFGGDEFIVLLTDLGALENEAADQVSIVGNKILDSLNKNYFLAEYEHFSSASIGVTLFSDPTVSADDLLKQADLAMYHAKAEGRNALRFFDPQMQARIDVRTDIERKLRKALGSEQFCLYFQPQVDVSGRIFGAEALVRWMHPERGMIPPTEFIPLAEETGLIVPIGQWVLETACIQLKSWEQQPLTEALVLSINVSAKQFYQSDYLTKVKATIQRYAISPKKLKLELTESALIGNIQDTVGKMIALHELGIQFSLDDFGTGYSSLQYLRQLPLDQLKVDQTFVRDIAIDHNDHAIVRTVIAMAHSLGLQVIAEGVETEEQRDLLMKEGCTHYQGYLFSKPIPIQELEDFITVQHPFAQRHGKQTVVASQSR